MSQQDGRLAKTAKVCELFSTAKMPFRGRSGGPRSQTLNDSPRCLLLAPAAWVRRSWRLNDRTRQPLSRSLATPALPQQKQVFASSPPQLENDIRGEAKWGYEGLW